ncbi:MAG TPA: hypothetical protein VHN55_06270 [Sphingomicrobium sp.]|nr:hypothetical protein [Sphingomicrobium sp.]
MQFNFRDFLSARRGSDSAGERALAEFRLIMIWIAAIGAVMVAVALLYLAATGELDANLVVATVVGVFFSVLLGCGLFAAAFFSDKSGHDRSVSDAATRHESD